MGQPFVGEIRMFAGSFAPVGWHICDGSVMAISENETLFNLIGTTYGGDGQATFALPDLQGRLPIHQGTNAGTPFTLGENGGVEEVTLTVSTIPAHTHPFGASTAAGTSATPSNTVLAAAAAATEIYRAANPAKQMASNFAQAQGGSQPHTNLQPYLCLTFIISLYGIYPSQN